MNTLRIMELADSVINKPSLWKNTRWFQLSEMTYFYAGLVVSQLIVESDAPPDIDFILISVEDSILCKLKRNE